jgi:hypothetical protein
VRQHGVFWSDVIGPVCCPRRNRSFLLPIRHELVPLGRDKQLLFLDFLGHLHVILVVLLDPGFLNLFLGLDGLLQAPQPALLKLDAPTNDELQGIPLHRL